MKEKKLKKKKSKKFILFMLLYICIWISATLVVDGLIWDKAWAYQSEYDKAKTNSQPEIFMDDLLTKIDAEMLTEWLGESDTHNVSDYAVADEYEQYFKQILDNKLLEYSATETKNIYDITANGNVVAKVKIGSNNVYDKFNFSGWKIISTDVASYMYGTFDKTIVADKSYSLYVNGKELTDTHLIMERVTPMGEYMSGITGEKYGTNIYKIEGFLVEPEIYAVDKNGNNVQNTSDAIDMAEFIDADSNLIDEVRKQRVVNTFHIYFEHMNKLKEYDEMKAYLVSGTDAYSLIANAQDSLKWVTPVKEIRILEEVIDGYVEYGDGYFSCNLYMNVLKDYGYTTKNEYFDAVVLFKKVGEQWYLDTFMLND